MMRGLGAKGAILGTTAGPGVDDGAQVDLVPPGSGPEPVRLSHQQVDVFGPVQQGPFVGQFLGQAVFRQGDLGRLSKRNPHRKALLSIPRKKFSGETRKAAEKGLLVVSIDKKPI
jgi:hypothetical protein